MSVLSKIILIVFILVSAAFLLKLSMNSAQDTELPTELPIGSPNVPRSDGSVVPTDVGFKTDGVAPLPTILSKQPSYQFQEAMRNVHNDVYALFPCSTTEKETNVLMLLKKSQMDGELYTTRAAVEALTAWEPYVFSDVGALIFPNELMPSSVPLVSFNTIGDGVMRRTPVSFADERGGFIYMSEYYEYMFYGASLQCVEAAQNFVYNPD